MARAIVFVLLFALPGADAAAAPPPDIATLSNEALIDALQASDTMAPGIDDTAEYNQFIAGDAPPQMSMGLIPNAPPNASPQMRELVRRGAAALPALIAHLRDARPTHILVGSDDPIGGGFLGGQFFGDAYDARDPFARTFGCEAAFHLSACPEFKGTYTIKIGDVCEVLIGQIVNRNLDAARYQPTAIVFVMSPVMTPKLAWRIARDWRGLTPEEHAASLLADARRWSDAWMYASAFVRLRFYYPAIYAGLGGGDAVRRAKFEAIEARERGER